MYDEFWDAVVDLGLPPSFHILTSRTTGEPFGNVRGPRLNSFMTILRANQDIIGVLIFGAVFERHPELAGRLRRSRRGLGAALDVPRRSRVRPPPQLADRGRVVEDAERVLPRAHVLDVPRRLGRVPHGRPDEPRATHVGERLPAQRRDVAATARRCWPSTPRTSTSTSASASCTTTSRSSTASMSDRTCLGGSDNPVGLVLMSA